MMSEKDALTILISVLNLVVVTAGFSWAMRRFEIERTHHPRMEFMVECQFLGPHHGHYVCEVLIRAKNRGLIRHEFRKLDLRIRGIPKDKPLSEWQEHKPRLLFPEKLLETSLLYAPQYDYIFVEPGVEQVLTYAARIEEQMRFVAVRAEFFYANGDSHSAERVFEVKAPS